MNDMEKLINGIWECDLNGGVIGNCPYKEIITILKEKDEEIKRLKEIVIKADDALESIKEKLNELLYEDFRRERE